MPAKREPAARRSRESGADRPTEEWLRKRREILDVAADVFFTHGFERGTTKEIAARVGMSQPSLYHYVGSKEVLLSEIARQVDRDFTLALDAALAVEGEPADQLRRIIDAFVSSLVINQRTFAVYWKEYRSLPEQVAREAHLHEIEFTRRVEDVVARAQAAGVLPARHTTRILSEGILGMMSWMHWWYRPDVSTAAEVAAAFKDLIGLGTGELPGAVPESGPAPER
ncbi:TetR/AcrR family transcriptional regulator [Embleya sp. AB8]|uniref:TetR/AcrR family transcriptional regulator n=1 Tax=Embleya sp. AB8 TaxID=3156304 RepID=UPI003C71BE1E